MAPSPIAIIAGVGPGTGAAVARRFAQTYPVVLLARSASNYEPVVDEINKSGGKAVGISADITDEESVNGVFDQIKKGDLWKDGGEFGVAAAVFNLGGGFVIKPFLELTKEEFESGWKTNGFVRFFFFPLILIHSPSSALWSESPHQQNWSLPFLSLRSTFTARHRLGTIYTEIPSNPHLYRCHGLHKGLSKFLTLCDG